MGHGYTEERGRNGISMKLIRPKRKKEILEKFLTPKIKSYIKINFLCTYDVVLSYTRCQLSRFYGSLAQNIDTDLPPNSYVPQPRDFYPIIHRILHHWKPLGLFLTLLYPLLNISLVGITKVSCYSFIFKTPSIAQSSVYI